MIIIRSGDIEKIATWQADHRGGILQWLYSEGVLLIPDKLTLPREEDFEQAFIRAMLEPVPEESEHPELM